MQLSSDITQYFLNGKDGPIGAITDLLFDERHYGLRWVVVDTGTWLPGRKVLLPPSALGVPDPATRSYPVDLDRADIKAAPGLDSDAPVSRQMETDIYNHYAWSPYWIDGYGHPIVGVMPVSGGAALPSTDIADAERTEPDGDPCLRSVREVTGYYIEATDGSIGHVEDFLIDESGWVIRYLIIDTKNWWPGKKVLISPTWLREVVWADREAIVDATRDKIKAAPELDPSMSVDRDYEERVFKHYGYHPHW
ncbi:PRC-barrel domain-containing protein [Yoonia sp.]|uniref:PRC-barrel domain-containing protein n=1 Tax=Yoonia sp. TaxID=2212373 RepID=UPI00391BA485